ncbi:MAG: hypothetical protein K6A90_08395 [Lachnospiraceae bacterium]|nr:hypothetical protein [Lachnospiraceae bacterium]
MAGADHNSADHIPVDDLPYCRPVKQWMKARCGKEAARLWKKTVKTFNLSDK